MIACAMDPHRERLADQDIVAGTLTVPETPTQVSRWTEAITRCLNVWITEFERKHEAELQEVTLLRLQVSELRLIVNALEERLDCERNAALARRMAS